MASTRIPPEPYSVKDIHGTHIAAANFADIHPPGPADNISRRRSRPASTVGGNGEPYLLFKSPFNQNSCSHICSGEFNQQFRGAGRGVH